MLSWPEHGAMSSALSEQLGEPIVENIIDFSVNTNPYGPPPDLKQKLKEWTHTVFEYPDPRQRVVKTALADFVGCEEKQVLPGNGGAELIFAVARLFYRKRVVLMEPAFTEYKKALQANEAEIITITTSEETAWQWDFQEVREQLANADAIWLCHPNNPTGKAAKPANVEQLLNYCYQRNKWMIVDEAFYDFQVDPFPLPQYISEGYPLVLLRSLTKMFVVPGLRIGYLVAPASITKSVEAFLPAWNMNSIAEKAILDLLDNSLFVRDSVSQLTNERERVQHIINTQTKFYAFSSDVNFYLLRHKEKKDTKLLLTHLAKAGIHARHTYHFPALEGKYIRLAVKTGEENDQLLSVLSRGIEE